MAAHQVPGPAFITLFPARPAGPAPIRCVFSRENGRNFFPQKIAPICDLNYPERLCARGETLGRPEFTRTVTTLKAPGGNIQVTTAMPR
jgi:hypothetical protein